MMIRLRLMIDNNHVNTHTHTLNTKDSTKEIFNFYATEYILIRKLTKTKVCSV